jgi:predicted nucleotidyltransferase component of viral defense system
MTDNSELFRLATPEEKDFYFNKLYPLQDDVLKSINTPAFYLTGGTALSRFHYQHRFSDDLDFFYDGFAYPKENFHFSYREIVSNFEKICQTVEVTVDGEFFKRLFVNRGDVSLKIEFIYEHYRTVGEKKKINHALVDSKENISANKIGAVLDRRTAKDFIDLYFLLNDVELEKAVEWSKIKKVPPDYEGLMIGVGDLMTNPGLMEGNVLTLEQLDGKDFERFTRALIRSLLNESKNR